MCECGNTNKPTHNANAYTATNAYTANAQMHKRTNALSRKRTNTPIRKQADTETHIHQMHKHGNMQANINISVYANIHACTHPRRVRP